MEKLKIYTSEWCPDCWAAKRTLDDRGLEYQEIDIEQEPNAAQMIVEAMGKRVLPSLEYKGRWIDGNRFDRAKFEKELDTLLG